MYIKLPCTCFLVLFVYTRRFSFNNIRTYIFLGIYTHSVAGAGSASPPGRSPMSKIYSLSEQYLRNPISRYTYVIIIWYITFFWKQRKKKKKQKPSAAERARPRVIGYCVDNVV